MLLCRMTLLIRGLAMRLNVPLRHWPWSGRGRGWLVPGRCLAGECSEAAGWQPSGLRARSEAVSLATALGEAPWLGARAKDSAREGGSGTPSVARSYVEGGYAPTKDA